MRFPDLLKKAKRGPQVVLLKDAAIIAAYTGLRNGDLVVDAGTGSGWLVGYLAQIVAPDGRVITYEKRKEFAKIAKANFKLFGLNNIELKQRDIFEGIDERDVDLITLDLKDAHKLIPQAEAALKRRGWLVAYLPQITQVLEFERSLPPTFKLKKVLEIIERPWIIKDKIARPEQKILSHTAFLLFVRKVSA